MLSRMSFRTKQMIFMTQRKIKGFARYVPEQSYSGRNSYVGRHAEIRYTRKCSKYWSINKLLLSTPVCVFKVVLEPNARDITTWQYNGSNLWKVWLPRENAVTMNCRRIKSKSRGTIRGFLKQIKYSYNNSRFCCLCNTLISYRFTQFLKNRVKFSEVYSSEVY